MNVLVNIDVPDAIAARRFYEEGLRFSYRRTLFQGAVVEMAIGDVRIYLIESAPGSRPVRNADAVRDYGPHWTPVHIDVVVNDIDAAVHRAVTAGAMVDQPVRSHGWGKLCGLRDPFGHGICVLEFIGDGYDLEITQP